MYSKARIAGHPIHPMLIAFPVALYVSTVVALFAFLGTYDPFWYRVAMWANIAGVVTAAVAAIPGLIDLIALPAKSRARVTGLRHAAFNVLALSLFAISAALIYRSWSSGVGAYRLDATAPLVLSLLGVLSTVTAGWLGWIMVQNHHVGVHPSRYDRGYVNAREVDDLDELAAGSRTPYLADDRETIRH